MTVLLRVGHALRESLAEGYRGRDLRADLGAGLVVGIVAVPLSMALAIASGVAPERGLWTAIVAGGLAALLGGSRVQVSGPTAAFVVILAPIAGRFGVEGLAIATVLAGLMLVAMGLFRLGRLVEFIPYPVTTGFTAGIGVVIATMQVQPFLGLSQAPLAADAGTAARLAALVHALPSARPSDVVAGATTLALLLVWRRVRSRVPAPLVALGAGALVAWALERFLPGTDVVTLADRFGTSAIPAGIPRQAPSFSLPWSLPGAAGAGAVPLSLALVRELLPPAFAIAVLGAIESLLSAVIADGMSGQRHDPDVELLALGVANVCSPFFGGIPATGAIARTATNVRSGARTPLAAVMHSLFVLAAMLSLAPLLGRLPMASLAALLLVVAWNMSEARHLVRMVRVAPLADTAVLLACFLITVVFDMTLAVSAGVVLAALLFMRRMVEISGARLFGEHHPAVHGPLPDGVVVYEIAGPLFFGAAHKATAQLATVDRARTRLVILELSDVPAIDATGLFNLESALDRLRSLGIDVVLTGLQAQPRRALTRAGVIGSGAELASFPDLDGGLRAARERLGSSPV